MNTFTEAAGASHGKGTAVLRPRGTPEQMCREVCQEERGLPTCSPALSQGAFLTFAALTSVWICAFQELQHPLIVLGESQSALPTHCGTHTLGNHFLPVQEFKLHGVLLNCTAPFEIAGNTWRRCASRSWNGRLTLGSAELFLPPLPRAGPEDE